MKETVIRRDSKYMLHAHLNNVGRNRHFSSENLQTVLISKLEI